MWSQRLEWKEKWDKLPEYEANEADQDENIPDL
jgi:hypothetical protein